MRSQIDKQASLMERLTARREELEEAILARVRGIADPNQWNRQCSEGLRIAVSAAVGYGFAVVDPGRDWSDRPIPPTLLIQARLAARSRMRLDTLLRWYYGGNAIFLDFLVGEAEQAGCPHSELRRAVRAQSGGFDRLLAAVSEEHVRETDSRLSDGKQRRAEVVRRLLAGEIFETSQLNYNLDCWHLAFLVRGADTDGPFRELAMAMDRAILAVDGGNDLAWIWLGGRRPYDSAQLDRLCASPPWPSRFSVAFGEPGEGLAGWRFSHRQAVAALPIAQHDPARVARYSDEPLLAAALSDDLLANSLRRLYLEPLEAERDAVAVKATLRAYFGSRGNASSAAITLGISRRTVSSRVAAVEDRLGRRVDDVRAGLEVALALDELDAASFSAG